MQPGSRLADIGRIVGILLLVVIAASPRSVRSSSAAEQSPDAPAWLQAHVGEDEGQIADVVLHRARALYLQKTSEGTVKNPCYFAMDATRPSDVGDGKPGPRFYVICESERSFRAISSGHGGGRNLRGIANFANGRRCAKNFSNALDSKLTAGGAYVTGETKASFKGYYRVSKKQKAVLIRSFIQFDGEGETANARQREIGGHSAELLRGVCLLKDPGSAYANHDGYVLFGKRVVYAGGRSNGCTSWSPVDVKQIIAMTKDNPTTLYIYPEVSRHRRRRAGGDGRPLPFGRGIILERFLPETNRRPEILAKGIPRADHRSIQEGSSAGPAAANADLQGAMSDTERQPA